MRVCDKCSRELSPEATHCHICKTPNDKHAALWRDCVGKGQALVVRRERDRLEIAALALKAVKEDQGYTLKRFADEIGMEPHTLARWCQVKTKVVDKLPPGTPVDYTAAHKTQQSIKATTPKKTIAKVYKKTVDDLAKPHGKRHDQVDRYISHSGTIAKWTQKKVHGPDPKDRRLQILIKNLETAVKALKGVVK